MADAWHVVTCLARSEAIAAEAVAGLGIRVYLPTVTQRIRHARKSKLVKRALFPGYFFTFFDSLADPSWPRIFSRRGVRGMILDGLAPKPVPESQMVMVREIAQAFVGVICDKSPFSVGQAVKIVEGVFSGFPGAISRSDETHTLDVSVKLFNRSTTVTVPRDHVRAV